MASRLKGTWDIADGPNLDDHEWAVVPSVKYRTVDFDAKHRYFFDLNYRPSDDRCLACHSVAPKDAAHVERRRRRPRGGRAEVRRLPQERPRPRHRPRLRGRGRRDGQHDRRLLHLPGLSSRGGRRRREDGRRRDASGPPTRNTPGIPLVHFKRLACTVCHSGPKPKEGFTRVRTSRANRLGIYGVATWSTDTPAILEPVYKKDAAHKIAPHRLVWPAYWALRSGKDLAPLKPGTVEAAAGDILGPEERDRQGPHRPEPGHGRGRNARPRVGPLRLRPERRRRPRRGEAGRGEGRGSPAFWGIRKGAEVLPLVPDFDPAAADKDPAIETRFQEFLQALGHGRGPAGRAGDRRPEDALSSGRRLPRRLGDPRRARPGGRAGLAGAGEIPAPGDGLRRPDRDRQGGHGADADRGAGRPRPRGAGEDGRRRRHRLSLRRPALPSRQERTADLPQGRGGRARDLAPGPRRPAGPAVPRLEAAARIATAAARTSSSIRSRGRGHC